MNRLELERDLRARTTDAQYTMLVRNLEGAVEAFNLLRETSPGLLRAFFSDLHAVSTEDVSDQAQIALEELIAELRAAREPRPIVQPPQPSRQVLRLAYSGL